MADTMASAQVIARQGAAPRVLGEAQAYFRARGFEVTAPFAGSFSISGPDALFEATFGVALRRAHGQLQADSPAGPSDELPRHQLPREWAAALRVAFSPPPAFGPAGY